MAYNETIAEQVRQELGHVPDVYEIKMYGGIAFMVNDKMCVCVGGRKADKIMVRVGANAYEEAMKDRPIKGYIDLDNEGQKNLRQWVELALKFNKELVGKKK